MVDGATAVTGSTVIGAEGVSARVCVQSPVLLEWVEAGITTRGCSELVFSTLKKIFIFLWLHSKMI